MPRFRTCNEWADDYRQIIDQLPVCEHTKVNRRCALVHVLAHLGNDDRGLTGGKWITLKIGA